MIIIERYNERCCSAISSIIIENLLKYNSKDYPAKAINQIRNVFVKDGNHNKNTGKELMGKIGNETIKLYRYEKGFKI